MIKRAKEIGFKSINIGEIYDYNIPSQKLFKGLGFVECGQASNGKSYILNIYE